MLLDEGSPVIFVLEGGLNNLIETHLDKIVSSADKFPEYQRILCLLDKGFHNKEKKHNERKALYMKENQG